MDPSDKALPCSPDNPIVLAGLFLARPGVYPAELYSSIDKEGNVTRFTYAVPEGARAPGGCRKVGDCLVEIVPVRLNPVAALPR